MDTNTGVIDTEATETGQEPYRLCLYTPDGILHTSEMENLTLRHIATQGKGNLLCQTADGIKKLSPQLTRRKHPAEPSLSL